jgi:hypothetical protein
LDGAGLTFSDTNATSFFINDTVPGTPGTIVIQGALTLGAMTTTTMNCTNNTADMLVDNTGAITLNGTLNITITGGKGAPTQPLKFFQDGGGKPSLTGKFSITDSLKEQNDVGTLGKDDQGNQFFQVSFAP